MDEALSATVFFLELWICSTAETSAHTYTTDALKGRDESLCFFTACLICRHLTNDNDGKV